MNDQSVILADKPTLPVFQIAPAALAVRDEALANSALIARVENAEQNKRAVEAHIFLKRVAADFEKARKKLKEPLIEAGRQLDRVVSTEVAEVEKEVGRLSQLTAAFQLAEQRRIREEQEAQARELARIEAEKQAEIQRIAREQAEREAEARKAQDEADRKAREEREAAARAVHAANTSKTELEAAEKRLADAKANEERLIIERERLAAESAARSAQEMQLATERAQAASQAEAKPITATRSFGQVVKTDWEITVVNPYELAKFHPDCVKIEPLLSPIKQALNAGITVKGIKAEKITKSGVRAGNHQLIEV